MSAVFKRLSCFAEDSRPRRRKAARNPVSHEALIESTRGEQAEAILGDVSIYGCSVRCAADWLRAGRFVSIGIAGDEALQAVVRWCRDGVAGLEFLRPIPTGDGPWQELSDSPWGA